MNGTSLGNVDQADILRVIGEQYAIPMDLLAEFMHVERSVAVDRMKEFVQRRLVDARRFFVNDEPWVWLREAGAEYSASNSNCMLPSPSRLPHYRALSEVRLSLEKNHPDGQWISTSSLEKNIPERHQVPDAVFRVPSKGRLTKWAIEVECGEESTKFYRTIVSHRCKHYSRVLFYCAPALARKLELIPEFENPKVHISKSLRAASDIENFQWRMSPTSGPENSVPRQGIEPWEGRVVRRIAEQYAIPLDQFARFAGLPIDSARRIANHLDEAGFVDQGIGPAWEPPWLWVTPDGARLAETGLAPNIPSVLETHEIRRMNEAWLYMCELNPGGRWWSKAMLRRTNPGAEAPVGVVRENDQEYAVEIEPDPLTRESLIDKYERRYAEHRSERRGVLVLCSTENVPLFEQLKQEFDLINLHVDVCPAFEKGNEPGSIKPMPLTGVPANEMPSGLLEELREKEGLRRLPEVKLVGKRRPRGLPRWLIATNSKVWCAIQTPLGWLVTEATEEERKEEIPRPDLQRRPVKHTKASPRADDSDAKPKAPPAQTNDKPSPESLPIEALREIQEKAGLAALPAGLTIIRDSTAECPRWRVEFGNDVWWVTREPKGGCTASRVGPPAPHGPPAQAPQPGPPKTENSTRSPRDPEGVMKEVDVSTLPQEVRDAIQREGRSVKPPEVLSAERRNSAGAPRWRVVTNMDIWRVTHSPNGWLARLSD